MLRGTSRLETVCKAGVCYSFSLEDLERLLGPEGKKLLSHFSEIERPDFRVAVKNFLRTGLGEAGEETQASSTFLFPRLTVEQNDLSQKNIGSHIEDYLHAGKHQSIYYVLHFDGSLADLKKIQPAISAARQSYRLAKIDKTINAVAASVRGMSRESVEQILGEQRSKHEPKIRIIALPSDLPAQVDNTWFYEHIASQLRGDPAFNYMKEAKLSPGLAEQITSIPAVSASVTNPQVLASPSSAIIAKQAKTPSSSRSAGLLPGIVSASLLGSVSAEYLVILAAAALLAYFARRALVARGHRYITASLPGPGANRNEGQEFKRE